MVESIGRESFPIMNCASWSVFRYSLQEHGQTKLDEGMMHGLAGTEDAERTS